MEKSSMTVERFLRGEDGRRFYYIPFEVPQDVEEMTVVLSYGREGGKNRIDMALVAPDGTQVGASVCRTDTVTLSEAYSTPGYTAVMPAAGTWQIIAGTDRISETGVSVRYDIEFRFKTRRWLRGDCHLHTYNSDGVYSPSHLIAKCRKKGFDFIIITDHNSNIAGQSNPTCEGMLIIKGEELTTYLGHVNFWGVQQPFKGGYCVNSFDDMKRLINEAKSNGATVSVNHPTCKNCTWLLPLEGFPLDCVEVWNGPMRIDNMTAVDWWHGQLLKGRRLAAVGGSDYHRDYAGLTDFLGNPTTVVLSESNTSSDVLAALREGRSVITHDPGSSMIYLECGSARLGDTVDWTPDTAVSIKATGMHKGHTLVVYNNDERIYEYTATRPCDHSAEIKVPHEGFVRAEILYEYNAVTSKGYDMILRKIMPKDVGLKRPPFAWCLTNPIFFRSCGS